MFQEAITKPEENVETSAQTSPNPLALTDSKKHSRVQRRKVTCRQETVSLPPFKAARPRLCLPGRSRLRDTDPILPPGQARRASGRGQRSRCSRDLKVWVCRAKDATMNQPSGRLDSLLSRGPLRPSAPRLGPPPGPCTLDLPQAAQGHQAPRRPPAPEGPHTPARSAGQRQGPPAGVRHASLPPGGRPPNKPLVFV